ncbi:hypothetical protein D3C86_1144300 [compost metagenome]
MDTQPCGPDEAFARDLVELDADLGKRIDQSNAVALPADEHRKLISGLLGGMTYIGRPVR